jgi:SulP family sulfate permease
VLSSLFFIYRISAITRATPVELGAKATLADGRRVAAWRLFGSLFFGSVTTLENLLDAVHPAPDVVVLDFHHVINIDTSGMDALESLHAHLRRRNARLVVADLNEQPLSLLRRSGVYDLLGPENVQPDLAAALAAASHPGPSA